MRLIHLSALLTLLSLQTAWACEPCAKRYDAEASKAEADLIFPGTYLDKPEPVSRGGSGPAFIRVKIGNIAKGAYEGSTIKLRSYYGMCPNGFLPQTGKAVFLVKKVHDQPTDTDEYTTVFSGCGSSTLPAN